MLYSASIVYSFIAKQNSIIWCYRLNYVPPPPRIPMKKPLESDRLEYDNIWR
jgi:hypothetical protein